MALYQSCLAFVIPHISSHVHKKPIISRCYQLQNIWNQFVTHNTAWPKYRLRNLLIKLLQLQVYIDRNLNRYFNEK